MIMAQEIIVDNASYPTEKIGENSHNYRPLGLGFANLGALLMSFGIPYDSDQGRDYAGAITAIMCGQAYLTSARIAERHRPVRRLRRERAAVPGSDPHASRLGEPHQPPQHLARLYIEGAQHVLGRGLRIGPDRRLPQRAGHGDRAHRHHRLHDGLRHHRHRAGSGAREIQEAGGRRRHQDRQQHRAAGAHQAGLHAGAGGADRHATSIRTGTIEGAPGSEARASAGIRLQFPPAERRALHPLHGPRAHDGGGAAVHFRRHFEDHQHARRSHRGRNHGWPTPRAGSWG